MAEEETIYTAAGLALVPPELREGRGEVEAAANDALPDLIGLDDLQGSLHNHSTYSDGAHSLRDMAEAARNLGLSYFGICDHSQSLQVAGGLSTDEVERQQEEIQALNASYAAHEDEDGAFRIFSGIESDILKDGSLDYDEDVLASFDFIVASVHTGFSMSKAEATERILRAVENPYTRILGHPTGRLLLVREGYDINHERVIDACAAHGVAIELNANPYRLDLDWRWVHRATDAGVLISINPDAHATGELENVRWGVEVARKGADAASSAQQAGEAAESRVPAQALEAARRRAGGDHGRRGAQSGDAPPGFSTSCSHCSRFSSPWKSISNVSSSPSCCSPSWGRRSWCSGKSPTSLRRVPTRWSCRG